MNEIFYSDLKLLKTDTQQFEAYRSVGNIVVTAGPGSGKTRVLTLKAMQLLDSKQTKGKSIACISYSRETVRELKTRLKQYGFKSSSKNFIGTMHGFCLLHIIRPFAHLFPEYNIPAPLKVASKDLLDKIFNGVLDSMNLRQDQISLTDINKQRCLSFAGNSNVQIQMDAFETQAAIRFEERLKESGHLDFISMVNVATKMIKEQVFIKKVLQAKFAWLLIDEYQDLGKPLHEMVLDLQDQTTIKIFAVGDTNQSIYGFNGAYPEFLSELNSKMDFKSIELESNYRSNQEIIESSLDALNPHPIRPKYQSKLRSEEKAEFTFITCAEEKKAQYEVIANQIIPNLLAKGIPYNEIGILVGSNSFYNPEVNEMANILEQNGIPFYIAKWDFKITDVVYWLQNCANWCCDHKSQSFDEIYNFWKNLISTHKNSFTSWNDIRLRKRFHSILTKAKETETIAIWLNYVLENLKIFELVNNSDRHLEESDNLTSLINQATNGNLKENELIRFAKLGEPDNEITVTTRHSSKGLEFEAVIIPGMEEGRFPDYRIEEGSRSMEEAHRICYVCLSRAKKEIILLRSEYITIRTRRGPWRRKYIASRFWKTLQAKYGTNDNTYRGESV